MSYTELQSGNITVIGTFSEVELDEYMKNVVQKELPNTYNKIIKNGFPSWCKNWLNVFNDYVNDKRMYIYRKETLFKVFNVKNYEEYGYFCDVTKTGDKEYKFITQYYNGGTCLFEILEEEANKIVNKLKQ